MVNMGSCWVSSEKILHYTTVLFTTDSRTSLCWKNSCFTAVLQCFAKSFTKASIHMQIQGDVVDQPRRTLSTGEMALWSFSLSYLSLGNYTEVNKTSIKPVVLQCFLDEHVCRNTKLASTSLWLSLLGDAWKASLLFYHIFQLRRISRLLLKKTLVVQCFLETYPKHSIHT